MLICRAARIFFYIGIAFAVLIVLHVIVVLVCRRMGLPGPPQVIGKVCDIGLESKICSPQKLSIRLQTWNKLSGGPPQVLEFPRLELWLALALLQPFGQGCGRALPVLATC